MEEELDVVLFDRSGHRTKFTMSGGCCWSEGAFCWKPQINCYRCGSPRARLGNASHHCDRALVPTPAFFPLIDKLAAKANPNWQLSPKCWRGRGNGWSRGGRYRYRAGYAFSFLVGDQLGKLYTLMNVYVAAPDHPIHQSRNRYLK